MTSCECITGRNTVKGIKESTAASGVSAASATTAVETAAGVASGSTAVFATTPGGSVTSAATSGVSVVVYAAQIHHKAIPIVGSAKDRGISSGTGGLK